MNKRKIVILLFYLFLFSFMLFSDSFYIYYGDDEKYQLTVRGNVKVYHNNKYKGLFVKEMKGILHVCSIENDQFQIMGNIYHYTKTIRGKSSIGFKVDGFEKCQFILGKDGAIKSIENPAFPPLKGIPYFPQKNIDVGDAYEGLGTACVALYNAEQYETIKIFSTANYVGKKNFLGNEVDWFKIVYGYGDIVTDGEIVKARGKHELNLYFDNSGNKPLFMDDHFVEEFSLKNGDVIKRDGFLLYFYKLIIPMNKKKMVVDLKKDFDQGKIEDLEVTQKDEGLSITINNLKFKADSTDLLASEHQRLEELAKILLKIEGRSFLIVGHTALAGTEEGRLKLSLERAEAISEYFVKSGIRPERLFHAGKGAKEPVAPNDTKENMQKNRRVEIIILED